MSLEAWISRMPVRLTKAGWWFVVAAVLTGISAYHSANNVLFLGLSFLLSGLLLNGLISWWNFSRLTFSNLRVGQSRAGEQTGIILDMLDLKKILPSYGLIALIEIVSPSGDVRLIRRFIRRVAGRRFVEIEFLWNPQKRGIHRIRLVRIESTFPFGFILKTYPMKLSTKALVWPAGVDVSGGLEFPSAHPDGLAVLRRSAGSMMDEIEGLRDYRKGDPMRHIHWRKTARTGIPVVKVGRSEQGRPQYRMAFDFEQRHFASEEQVDTYCGFVGSLSERLLEEGKDLEMILHCGDPLRIGGYAAWSRFMDELAVIEPSEESFADDSIRKSGFCVVSPPDILGRTVMSGGIGPRLASIASENRRSKVIR